MPQINFVQAINSALVEEMERDPLTFVMGEDVILERIRRDQGPASTSSVRCAFATRQFRRRASSVRRWALRWPGTRPICEVEFASFFYVRIRSGVQPGGQASLHVGRPGDHADHISRGLRRDGRRGGATFRNRVCAVPQRARVEAGGAFGAVGHEGYAQERDSRQQPGDRFRARRPRAAEGGSSGGRSPGAARQGRGETRGQTASPSWRSARWYPRR